MTSGAAFSITFAVLENELGKGRKVNLDVTCKVFVENLTVRPGDNYVWWDHMKITHIRDIDGGSRSMQWLRSVSCK